jgi:ribose/xylose/arabinose/galactoside ABC-type transport system permease subunit
VEVLGRGLMTLGVVFVAVGFVLWLSPQIPFLGKLPGDLRIERDGFVLYLPITTCLAISAVISLAAEIVARLRGWGD